MTTLRSLGMSSLLAVAACHGSRIQEDPGFTATAAGDDASESDESGPPACPTSELVRGVADDTVAYDCLDAANGESIDTQCCADAFADQVEPLGCPWAARVDEQSPECTSASGSAVPQLCCLELCDPAADYDNFPVECLTSTGMPVPRMCCERGTSVPADVCGGARYEDLSARFDGRSEHAWACMYPDSDAAAAPSCCLHECLASTQDAMDLPYPCIDSSETFACPDEAYADIRGICMTENLSEFVYYPTGCCRIDSDARHPAPDDECYLTGANGGTCNELVELLVVDVVDVFDGCLAHVSIDRADLGLVGYFGVSTGPSCAFEAGGSLTYQTHRLEVVAPAETPPTELPIELYLRLH